MTGRLFRLLFIRARIYYTGWTGEILQCTDVHRRLMTTDVQLPKRFDSLKRTFIIQNKAYVSVTVDSGPPSPWALWP